MEPSSSDLEFFDFKNSSDEEIKEIQAILKGPESNGGVELPWEISVKSSYTGSLSENEVAVLEANPESTKTAKAVDETIAQALDFVAPQTPLPPIAQLPPPPTVETFVTLSTTIGPYQNAPYFVSRTIPYLRPYPPMGVPFFACPMPGAGEANPYGQFVPMVPESEPSPKSRDNRQSSRRSSKKRLSDVPDNVNVYPNGSPTTTCPTSVPLVPLPVPPSTFVGGNLPLHGYPPGLGSSPAMYYVPVFNHPYGGYLSPSGHPMMLPVNVATDVTELKCSPNAEEILRTDKDGLEEDNRGGLSEPSPEASNGGLEESLHVDCGGCKEELLQMDHCDSKELLQMNHGGSKDLLQIDHDGKALLTNNGCSKESLPTDGCSSVKVLQTPVEEATPNVQSDCEVSGLTDIVDTQLVHPTAKTDIPEKEERIDSSGSFSGLLREGSCTNCFQDLKKCLEETVPSEALHTEKDSLKETVPVLSKDSTEKVKQVVRDQSRCWADLFKGPPSEVNGFETPPPRQRHNKKNNFNNGKRDIMNGKVYSVPASNTFH